MMDNEFWIEEYSPKQLYEDFAEEAGPQASFWELFEDYSPQPVEMENTDPEWLQQQAEIVNAIVEEHFKEVQLDYETIEMLIEALSMYVFLEEEDMEELPPEFQKPIWHIAQTYLVTLEQNKATISGLLSQLEEALVERNEDYIAEAEKAALQEKIANGDLSEEAAEFLMENFENILKTELEDLEDWEEEGPAANEFIYPHVPLAISTGFAGFYGDLDQLPYRKRVQLAQEKFEAYQAELSAILGQAPDEALLPKPLNEHSEEVLDQHYGLIEDMPFVYEFDGPFVAWKNEDKVLFLSMNQEDEGMPFTISLGGLTLDKYTEILTQYNAIATMK